MNETVKVYNEELVLVSTKTDTVQTTLVSVDNQRNQEFNSLQTQIGSTISSELTTLDSKLNSMSTSIASDFNGVSTDLNGISDDISNKIDDHAALTAAKLTNIEELLSEGVGPYTCGGTGGWRRAVYLDMTDLTTNCPSGWALTKRTCGRSTDGQGTCDSAYFPVIGGGYSAVCGMIKAYAFEVPLGFFGYYYGSAPQMDQCYFNGVAVMHGNPRQHIWTFAAGRVENLATNGGCPCDQGTSSNVGSDYFCEAGLTYTTSAEYQLLRYTIHADDPLWDGQGCSPSSTCCTYNNPPYFTKDLPGSFTDNIELRICNFNGKDMQDIAVERIELYVK